MATESFFERLGEILGNFIRVLVEALSDFFRMIGQAGANFIDGLSRALGMDPNWISILILIIGLLLLVSAVRAFLRGSIIWGLVVLLLAMWTLSLLIG
jgi:ABC-type proline/glycine betaine transport system permease subunit